MSCRHFVFLLVIQSLIFEVLSKNEDFYSAVVVEYSPYLNSSLDAEVNIMNNVKNYVNIIRHAASLEKKADIIVFPESSLIGYLNRQKLLEVPDPKDKVNPCIDKGDYEQPLVALSCAARATSTYVVVNLSEKFYNRTQRASVHFNTNVAFDRSGCVVARYRKIHLYVEGDRQPSPDRALVYFDTDFGVRFGLMTCFDIIFKEPGVDLAIRHNVSHFIFTSAWFSQSPFLTAIQEQYYWAYTQDACLLAAGYNLPAVGSAGSGVYLGRRGAAAYLMAEHRGSFMLQALVPKQCPSPGGSTKVIVPQTSAIHLDLPPQEEELNPVFKKGLDLLRSPNVLRTKQDQLDVFSTEIIQPPVMSPPEPDVAKFTLPFKVEKTLCQNTLCCQFTLLITVEFSRTKADVVRGDDYSQLYYRLAVFDGVKDYDGAATGGVQTCAIIPCISTHPHSCGLRSDNSSAAPYTFLDYYQTSFVFQSIEISGNFSTDNSFVGPNVLLKGEGQSYGALLLPNEFKFTNENISDAKTVFTFKTLRPTTIVTASLYGRLFFRDGSEYTKILTEESKSSILMFRLDVIIFIFVTLLIKYML